MTFLHAIEAVWLADKIDQTASHQLLFNDLINRLRDDPQSQVMWHEIRRLEKVWRLSDLDGLAELARDREGDPPLAALAMTRIREAKSSSVNLPLQDHHTQLALLRLLGKCQVKDLGVHLALLLQDLTWSLDHDVCDMLWLLGDKRAEGPLLRSLAALPLESQNGGIRRSDRVRALGTCGTSQCRDAVLEYLVSASPVMLHLPEETLLPLVRRQVLTPEDLVSIALSGTSEPYAASACLLTLSMLNASAFANVFLKVLDSSHEPNLQEYAIHGLGNTGDSTHGVRLRQILRHATDTGVIAAACLALAKLGTTNAIPEIEKALDRLRCDKEAGTIVHALQDFGAPSSKQPLLRVLADENAYFVKSDAIAALGAYWDADVRDALLVQLSEPDVPEYDEIQSAVIDVMVVKDPGSALQEVQELAAEDVLSTDTRIVLAEHLSHLYSALDDEGKVTLIEIGQGLIADDSTEIREEMADIITEMEPEFVGGLCEPLLHSDDPERRASAILALRFLPAWADTVRHQREGEDLIVRRAGDRACQVSAERGHISALIDRYLHRDRAPRLSTYFILQEHADRHALREVCVGLAKEEHESAFLHQLIQDVSERIRKDLQTLQDEEKIFRSQRGTVQFA